MSSTPPLSPISPSDLFAHLAAGLAGGMTVVTPNARLAQALLREFDAAQAAKGLQTWETADVLPWTTFVARLYDEALYSAETAAESGAAARLPILLTQPQELSLWEQAIEASPWGGGELLALSQAAADARQAWNTCHEWRIAEPALDLNNGIPRNEDAEAFAKWAAHYRQRCERDRHIDAARLPDLVTGLLQKGQLATPRQITAYAFDILPPQALMLFDACRERGTELHRCAADPCKADVRRWPFASAREEIETAARWARARLEAGHAPSDSHADQTSQASQATRTTGGPRRIGIVVPDLQQRRKEVARVLSRTLTPARHLPNAAATALAGNGAERTTPAFNISIGVPLTDYAIVHAALALIELATGEFDFALASRVLRSPFIGGAQSEAMLRARIDVQLRRIATPRLTLARLIAQLGDCAPAPLLQRHLEALLDGARSSTSTAGQGEGRKSTRTAEDWAQHFAALTKAAGFPGERTLDSAEYQTHAKWTETLAQFARLGRVLPAISARDALSRLRRLCANTLFQPESGSAPIQVLGILESAGLNYDHLWVCGLTDEAWPLAARPNPFIPTLLQKKAGIPEASADGALALDRRITDNWLGAAPEVVLSHALREDDRELPVSPLIAAQPEGKLDLPDYPDYRDLLFAARAREPLTSTDGAPADQAPPLGDAPVHGGSRVLADQAACPFRAFAHHRLGAQALETPAEGLDAAARGTLLHALMKGIWDDLKNKAALDATSSESLLAIVEKSAAAAVARAQRDLLIEPRFAELERARLTRLALEWLDVERQRPDFEVVASEDKRAMLAGGIALSGRIDRLDRLASGGHALIDYKSGRVTPNSWLHDRPDDPQMPLYAVNAPEDITAVAFARIKKGDMRMMGFSRDDKVLPKVKIYHDWKILLEEWKEEVDDLGREFADGAAGVDPKQGQQTCRYCDLAPLCRVHEKFSALELDGDDSAVEGTGDGAGGEA